MDADDLKMARIKRGLTQRQMADILGVERNHIYMVESGRRPVTERIEKAFRAWLKTQGEDGRKTKDASGASSFVAERTPDEIPPWAEALIDRLDALSRDMGVVKTALLRLAAAQMGRNPLEPEE